MKVALVLCAFLVLFVAGTHAANKSKGGARLAARFKARAATALTDCYSIKVDKDTKVCSGTNLLAAVRSVAGEALAGAGKLKAVDFPASGFKQCSSAPDTVTGAAQPGAGGASYYGEITNAGGFRKHAAAKCGGLNAANGDNGAANARYFSIGKYVYVRVCPGGAGNGYVYLWGTNDNTAVECKGHDYPSMYIAAQELDTSSKKGSPEKGSCSIDGFRALATAGTNPNPYLGMAGAAALIAEAARDYNVVVLNFMLMDTASGLDAILGGKCPSTATTCGNTKDAKNGLHPMAFGGAQASFTTGAWGQANGAHSDAGKLHEAGLIVDWFKKKAGATKATDCTGEATAPQCLSHVSGLIKKVANIA